jgi:hypothetical protein
MRNKIFSKIIIVFLIVQAGMISSTKLDVCFGEDGHIQIECSKSLSPNHHEDKLSRDKNEPARMAYNNPEKNACGDCHDIPLLSKFMINHRPIDFSKFLVDILPISVIYTDIVNPKEDLFLKTALGFWQLPTTYNPVLEKISLLI